MSVDTESGWVHESRTKLPGPPARVFAALTDPGQLTQWFAEYVDVQTSVGGKYHFWGKHSFQVPTSREATQLITRYEPDSLLGFSWRLGGGESDVTLRIEPLDGGRSELHVRHLFAAPQDRELMQDVWRVHSGNLYAYLDNGSGLVLPDFTSRAHAVHLSIWIDAPPHSVFAALTDPDQMRRWLGEGSPEVELRNGGRYSYGWRYTVDGREVAGGPTRILELVDDRKLVIDWPDWRGAGRTPDTQVSWSAEPENSGTRLTLDHTGFAEPTDIGDYGSGWWYYLAIMRRQLAPPSAE